MLQIKLKITAVNRQAKETQVMGYGVGDPKDPACPFKFNSENSIISLWLKSEAAVDFQEGDVVEVTKVP